MQQAALSILSPRGILVFLMLLNKENTHFWLLMKPERGRFLDRGLKQIKQVHKLNILSGLIPQAWLCFLTEAAWHQHWPGSLGCHWVGGSFADQSLERSEYTLATLDM